MVELAKTAQAFIFLKNQLGNMDVRDLQHLLQQTTWYKIQILFNWLAIVAGAYVFADTVRNRSGKAKDIKGLLLLTLPHAVLLAIATLVQF